MRRRVAPVLVAAAVTLAGCGGSAAERADRSVPSVPRVGPTPLPTREVPRSVAERCLVDVPGRVVDLPGPNAPDRLGAVAYGRGTTALVLLHQTGRGGLCGWVTYARWAASQGVLAVAVDDCLHGPSRCTDAVARDPRAMVAIAVEWARSQGATTVAVVGASMGGARALGVGQAAGGDVVVSLSGAERWDGVPDAVSAARATTVPLLVVSADGDRGISHQALAAAVAASPARAKRHLRVPGRAPGWPLTLESIAADAKVTREGRMVLEWVLDAAKDRPQG